MVRRYVGRLLWLLPLAVVALYFLDRYVWISPEEEVRRFVERGRRAVESRSILRCDPLLAADFVTGSGMDRVSFLYFARVHFAQLSDLRIQYRIQQLLISDDGSTAEADLSVLVSGTDRDGERWLGIRDGDSRIEHVTLRLEKRNDSWKAGFLDWEDSPPLVTE